MDIPVTLIICGWAYACSAWFQGEVSDFGVKVARSVAIRMTALGLFLEIVVRFVL